jgi:hypothetical protein
LRLGSQTGTNASPTWTYTASGNGCAGTLTLTIERQHSFQETVTGATSTINVIATHVSLSYPYGWRFSRVIKLIAPGAKYAGVTQIVTDAVVPNMY